MKQILVFCCLFLFVCSPSLAERAFRVGVALPLTGVGAPYGEAYKNGLLLGLREGNKHVKLEFEDHQYDNKKALSAVRKLSDLDKVDLIVVWGYAPSDAVAPIVSSLRPPVLLGSVNPVGRGTAKIFNLSSPISETLQPLLAYLQRKDWKSITILSSQIGSLTQTAETLKDGLPKDVVVVDDSFLPGEMNFRSVITRMKSIGSDAVGLFLTPPQIKEFIVQARSLDYSAELFGIDTFNDKAIFELFHHQQFGPVFVDAYSDTDFSEHYRSQYKDSSHIVEAARGVLLADLLKHVRKSVGDNPTRDDVTSALQSFPTGRGPVGPYQVVKDSDFGTYLSVGQVLYQVSSGQLQKLGKARG